MALSGKSEELTIDKPPNAHPNKQGGESYANQKGSAKNSLPPKHGGDSDAKTLKNEIQS